MKNQLIRSIVIIVAALLCLWGVKELLTRPLPKSNVSRGSSQLTGLPLSPSAGFAPSLNQPAADAMPADLKRVEVIRQNNAEYKVELLGGSAPSGYGPQTTLYLLRSIRVWKEDTLLQTILFDESYFQGKQGSMWTDKSNFGFVAQDMNFDGYTDFSVANCLWTESVQGLPFSFHFTWDAKKSNFVSAAVFDSLANPKFDTANHTIACAYESNTGNPDVTCQVQETYYYGEDQVEPRTKQELVTDSTTGSTEQRNYEWDGNAWVSLSNPK